MNRPVVIGLLLLAKICSAQNKTSPADLDGAQAISLNKTYHFDKSPAGFGNIQEFPLNQTRSNIYFEKERNTIWFSISIPISGTLTFEISPKNINDDYDWMLFNYTPLLKSQISNGTAKPVRTNNARNNKSSASKTGLKEGIRNLFENPGPGKSFSKPLEVKSGERLALLVDNIYDLGDGFDITVNLKPSFSLTGQLIGSVKSKLSGLPLKADVTLEDDSTGFVLSKAKTDSRGNYRISAPLARPLNVIADSKRYIFASDKVMLDTVDTKTVNLLLDTIAAGSKMVLFNIHFLPNSNEILPNSETELIRLKNFLQTKPEWEVKLTGHTNNNVFADNKYLQKLSFERAVAVKQYLVRNAIPETRITCLGVGGKTPLIQTKDPVAGMKNLRVEVELERK
ncbi:OmpA family protein [Pedobacter sp. HMF7647]|uniref:OmpA family protein n=1 Tax=Hufsiella arboris TaxID=2695275 RepID=A0A7K1Y6G2_9SPHI|nr:OmpA family protein [Hufsiella arboris]MXV49709.1 OmpA family protein [Hufsiella arboris]